jgi:hypothetical protein
MFQSRYLFTPKKIILSFFIQVNLIITKNHNIQNVQLDQNVHID